MNNKSYEQGYKEGFDAGRKSVIFGWRCVVGGEEFITYDKSVAEEWSDYDVEKFIVKDKYTDELVEMLQWFIDNDETYEGDVPMPEYGGSTWNEINEFWISGLNRARNLVSMYKDIKMNCDYEVLSRLREIAMEWTVRARFPECIQFGEIAQDLDALIGKENELRMDTEES